MKLNKEELINKINGLEIDDTVKVELMEDVTDSFEVADNSGNEELQAKYEELQAKYDELMTKYKERFLKTSDKKEDDEEDDKEELKEEEVIDVKEI